MTPFTRPPTQIRFQILDPQTSLIQRFANSENGAIVLKYLRKSPIPISIALLALSAQFAWASESGLPAACIAPKTDPVAISPQADIELTIRAALDLLAHDKIEPARRMLRLAEAQIGAHGTLKVSERSTSELKSLTSDGNQLAKEAIGRAEAWINATVEAEALSSLAMSTEQSAEALGIERDRQNPSIAALCRLPDVLAAPLRHPYDVPVMVSTMSGLAYFILDRDPNVAIWARRHIQNWLESSTHDPSTVLEAIEATLQSPSQPEFVEIDRRALVFAEHLAALVPEISPGDNPYAKRALAVAGLAKYRARNGEAAKARRLFATAKDLALAPPPLKMAAMAEIAVIKARIERDRIWWLVE